MPKYVTFSLNNKVIIAGDTSGTGEAISKTFTKNSSDVKDLVNNIVSETKIYVLINNTRIDYVGNLRNKNKTN